MSSDKEFLSHIIPSIEDWPISQFAKDREGFVERLIDFTLERLVNSSNTPLELLNKSVYLEIQRSKNNPWKVDPPDEQKYWSSLQKEVDKTTKAESQTTEQLKILKRIVHRYSEEILGDFNPKTFSFARKFLRAFFKRLLNNGWGRGQKGLWGSKNDLYRKIVLEGHVDEIRSLFNKGTVVIVPTHYSNLDSIMIGYGIDSKVGIPAFAYGAGLNLYDWELVAYYINRLGAYRVDRRKKNPIYLETLKSMASLSLIEGVNHIFFPGGTRSRSGAIEDKLKLGLLNSAIDAQRHCILNNVNQKVFIVPLSIGYHFVLEAKSLIEQHLRQTGKENYTRDRKKKSTFRSVLKFFKLLRKHNSEIHLSFGTPMDVLGNRVDLNGNSINNRGKNVSIEKYFSDGTKPNEDIQRESVYTRILADKIVAEFKCQNVVLSSHLLAFTFFKLIEKSNPELDIFKILRIPVKEIQITKSELINAISEYQEKLKVCFDNKQTQLSLSVKSSAEDCLLDGLNHLGVYHGSKVVKVNNKHSFGTEDLKLLYYYHNKLIHLNL